MQVLNKEKIDNKIANVTVSVIIATYRRDVSLKRALESLLNQNYESIEIIVVDDNADNEWNKKVEDIINELSLLHSIIYIKNEVNKGSAETRNIGIKAASGEYITFLDDDDIYLPNKIKNQVEHMIENNSDYSITDLELYDENERLIEKRNRKYIKIKDKENLLRYHLMYHMTGTDTLMFKRDYLLKIGGFPAINVGDEFYLIKRAIEADGTFSYLSLCDVRAYIHTKTDGLSNGDSKIIGENMLYEYKKKYFNKLSIKSIKYIKMRHYIVLAYAYYRRKCYIMMIKYMIFSFVSSPKQCLEIIFNTINNKKVKNKNEE